MSVDFITFCCKKDVLKLAAPGELDRRVKSHGYEFDNVIVIRQRLGNEFDGVVFSSPDFAVTELRSEDYPDILNTFHIKENAKAEELTHGPGGAHYWKWHCINHLTGLLYSKADYVVFSDSDCRIQSQPSLSWVEKGIELLRRNYSVLMVAPNEGGQEADRYLADGTRLTRTVSQQLFMCERARMAAIDFDMPWDWEYLAPGGPMAEFYYMLEGRIWRYIDNNDLYRAVLPPQWRYWHDQW